MLVVPRALAITPLCLVVHVTDAAATPNRHNTVARARRNWTEAQPGCDDQDVGVARLAP
jgi:hypothetical protein